MKFFAKNRGPGLVSMDDLFIGDVARIDKDYLMVDNTPSRDWTHDRLVVKGKDQVILLGDAIVGNSVCFCTVSWWNQKNLVRMTDKDEMYIVGV